jgi:hypothetical protein
MPDPLEIESLMGRGNSSSSSPSPASPAPPPSAASNKWRAVSWCLIVIFILEQLSGSSLVGHFQPGVPVPPSSPTTPPSEPQLSSPAPSPSVPPSVPSPSLPPSHPSDPSKKLFKFYDNVKDREVPDYEAHPHRDVPLDEFPESSWQVDDVYVLLPALFRCSLPPLLNLSRAGT